ncbi:hypothetical protein BLNAU_16905 [Blattamonas nauphoetae]|uniref:LisH domain-containing protein n=1 Tax=Blattamonas nauphoetae TaxID=2049346 RepID=A0ABQ9X7Z3_9EUKA|nr:hypothetical protein BLNAU_16905 [Blattamonas nauphoetae]
MATTLADELNYLIYLYMVENGFSHTAFTFANESLCLVNDIKDVSVPPARLIHLLQKGLSYMEIEQHINSDGTESPCTEPFNILTEHVCKVPDSIKSEFPDAPQ